MYKKSLIYIFTMLECIEKCYIYTDGFDDPDEFAWADDQMRLNATISLFIAIGEESKKIEIDLKNSTKTSINWSDVAKMRDKISHDYRGVDAEILLAVIRQDLPKLKEALIEMLDRIKAPKTLVDALLNSDHYKHLRYLKV